MVHNHVNALVSRTQTSILAVMSLVFGLLTWFVLPFVGAVVAVVCGHAARREIRHSGGLVDGNGLAISGLVLGWVNLLMWIALGALFFGLIGLVSGGFGVGHWIERFHDGACHCTMEV